MNKNQIRRIKIMEDQDYRCIYCTQKVKLERCNIDHLIPLGKGGADVRTNWVVACEYCNRIKSNLRLDQLESKWKWMLKFFENNPDTKYLGSKRKRVENSLKHFPKLHERIQSALNNHFKREKENGRKYYENIL